VCNLYAMMRSRAEAAALARVFKDWNNNQPPTPGVFPDYAAPVILKEGGQRVMRDLRWGMPSPTNVQLAAAGKRADKLRAKGKEVDFPALLKAEPDKGVTNIRNTDSRHWKPYLGPANRCLVPMTSFSEPDQVGGSLKPVWFARSDSRPLGFFAGAWTPWTGVRKISEGEVTVDIFGFLTTDSMPPVVAFHSKAMPVILTTPEEWDLWLSDETWDAVRHLQRPLPADALKVVATGDRKDEGIPA